MTKVSKETQEQALQIAKGTQQPQQTKAQTKLIAKGIEKGIAEYKKQQRKKSREQDKLKKSQQKKDIKKPQTIENQKIHEPSHVVKLPWILLLISWIGFVLYVALF